MARAQVWEEGIVRVDPERADEVLPRCVRAGRSRLDIVGHPEASPATSFASGVLTHRYPALWVDGRSRGTAYVELMPLSSYALQVVVHLEAPNRLPGRLSWRRDRLVPLARRLVEALATAMAAGSAIAGIPRIPPGRAPDPSANGSRRRARCICPPDAAA